MSVLMYIFGFVAGFVIGGLAILAGRLQTEVKKTAEDGDRQ